MRLPFSSSTYSRFCFKPHLPFHPNVVPAQESHPGVASLSSSQTSYPIRTVIQLVDVEKTKRADYTEHQKSAKAWLSLYSEFQKAHYFLSEQRKFSTLLSRVLNVYSFVTHLSISSVIMLTIKESQIPKKRDDQPMGRVITPICADHIA